MTTKTTTLVLAGALFLLPSAGEAGIINQDSFDDLGGITVDLTSGLEWLDLDVTVGLSYNEVLDSQYYSDGWRYATRTEYVSLLDNWYSTEIDGFDYEAQNNNGKLTLDASYAPHFEWFTEVFGYSKVTAANNNIGAPAQYTSEGMLESVYHANLAQDVMQIGTTITNKRIWNSGFKGTENFFNTYFINNQGAIDDGKNLNDYKLAGSWLVKDYSVDSDVNEVPEPSSWVLFSLAILGLGVRRFKQ